MRFSGEVKVAIVQARPRPFDVTGGILAMHAELDALAGPDLALIAYAETFVGGYPLWVDHSASVAQWQHPGAACLHQLLLDQALVAEDPRLEPLQLLVDRSGTLLSFGGHERVHRSLYNSQWLLRPDAPPLVHRKLIPTHGERLLWGQGDGSTLGVHTAAWGDVGMLMCWEHWMPLTRAAMHSLGEMVHIAAWPSVSELHLLASRHYAFEGRCFVLAAGAIQSRDDVLVGVEQAGGNAAALALIASMPDGPLQTGGSAILGPDSRIIAQAGDGAETLTATIALEEIGYALATFDAVGHYARPDVFTFAVNRKAQAGPF